MYFFLNPKIDAGCISTTLPGWKHDPEGSKEKKILGQKKLAIIIRIRQRNKEVEGEIRSRVHKQET